MRKIVLSTILLFCLSSYSSADWYEYCLNEPCTYDGDGTSCDCAAGAGQAGAFNVGSSITALTYAGNTGADLAICSGTTINDSFYWNWGGENGDMALIDEYDCGYGSADPVFDGRVEQSGPWSQYAATSIYSATNTHNGITGGEGTRIVTIDDQRLMRIEWNSDIATTSAQMIAGSFAHDTTNDLLYVWTSDSADPTTKTVLYSNKSYPIISRGTTLDAMTNYKQIQNIDFTGYNGEALFKSDTYGRAGWNNDSIIRNLDFDLCGGRCLRWAGDRTEVYNITARRCSSEDGTAVGDPHDLGCITVSGQSDDTPMTGWSLHDITVNDSVNGSAVEINFNASNGHVYNITGTNISHQLIEAFGVDNNRIENVRLYNKDYSVCTPSGQYLASEGHSCRVTQQVGVKFTNGSTGNVLKNFLLVGPYYSGVQTGWRSASTNYCGNSGNEIANGTIVATDSSASFIGLNTWGGTYSCGDTDTGMVWKNIIVNAGNGQVASISTTDVTMNNNDYYTTGGTFGTWVEATKANFSLWKSSSGQDADSVNADPLLTDDYNLKVGSPAINAGDDSVCPSTDINGDPQNTHCTIGADAFWAVKLRGFSIGGSL